MSGILKYLKKKEKRKEEEDHDAFSIQSENCDQTNSQNTSCDLMSLDDNISTRSADMISVDNSTTANDSDFFDNKSEPCRPMLKIYPSTIIGKSKRKFNSDWYAKYSWLEYNKEKDAAFCFACRVFLPNPSEKTFTHTGYRDWKNATDKSKGFMKHQMSTNHDCAMKTWIDYKSSKKIPDGSIISKSFVTTNTYKKKWLFAVFNVTRYLCANGQPFRGENESSIGGDGLFLRTFSQLVFQLDPEWERINSKLPKNAKYTSPTIQNEMIEVLTTIVKERIATEIRDAGLFTIMADGTTDKNHKEIQGLVFRYKNKDGLVAEHCLEMKNVDDRSAQGIMNFIRDTLAKYKISKDGIVSQSYDGASVMSGSLGGLQKLISDFCDRYVMYVHCFLHKIHLVVSFVMKNLDEIEEYFGIVTSLYNFFKKSAVNESYVGSALKRLIDTRWSGHFDSTKNINQNYANIIEALKIASKSKKLKNDDRVVAIGLLSQIGHGKTDPTFVFINCLLFNLLQPVNIAVKTLQSVNENAVSAFNIVNEVIGEIKEKKNNEKFREELENEVKEQTKCNVDDIRPKRVVSETDPRLNDFIVDQQMPGNKQRSKPEIIEECLDLLLSEFNRRFSFENVAIWQAMCALVPTTDHFLDFETLTPLLGYAETIPVLRDFYEKEKLAETDLKAECRIFGRVLKSKVWKKDEHGKVELLDVAGEIEQLQGAPILTTLYNLAITAGFTSTRVECAFSSLSRIDSAQRRSMTSERECQLSYLYFESEVLMQVSFEDFFKYWESKPRRI